MGLEEESECAEVYLASLLTALRADAADSRVFLVDPPLPCRERQQRLIELLFERLNVGGLYLSSSAVLASFYFSRESALIVDVGGENTFVTPVHDGFSLRRGLVHQAFGGEDITRQFDAFLAASRPDVFDFEFIRRRGSLHTPAHDLARLELVREVKEALFKVPPAHERVEFNPVVDNAIYELPDRKTLVVGRESYDLSELLFGGGAAAAFGGVPGLVAQSVNEMEMEQKRDVLGTVIFAGGASQHKVFLDRMVQQGLPRDLALNYRSKVLPGGKSDARVFSWVGASVVAALSTFDSMVLTRKDYEEHGYSLIERKFN